MQGEAVGKHWMGNKEWAESKVPFTILPCLDPSSKSLCSIPAAWHSCPPDTGCGSWLSSQMFPGRVVGVLLLGSVLCRVPGLVPDTFSRQPDIFWSLSHVLPQAGSCPCHAVSPRQKELTNTEQNFHKSYSLGEGGSLL